MKAPGALGLGYAAFVLAQVHAATTVLALPLLVLGLAVAFARDEISFEQRASPLELALGGFLAAWLVSAALGLDPARSLLLSVPLLAAGLAVFALGRDRNDGTATLLVQVLLAAATGVACLVLVAAARGAVDPAALVQQAHASLLVVPNDLAWAACLWPLWLRVAPQGTGRFVLGVALSLQLAAFVLLESRLALVLAGMAMLLAAPGAMSVHGLRVRWLQGLAAAALLALALVSGKGAASLEARMQLWQAAWALFLREPLAGVGPHNFVLAYGEHMAGAVVDARRTPWPHNLALEVLAQGGLLLGAATMLLLASAVRSACRRGAMRLAIAVPVLCLCLIEATTLRSWLWILVGAWLGVESRMGRPRGNLRRCTTSSALHGAVRSAPVS